MIKVIKETKFLTDNKENQSLNKELEQKTYELLGRVEKYSPETYIHSFSTGYICDRIACEVEGITDKDKMLLHYAALLHDVGKTKIPHKVLHKHAKFTDEELEIMKQHPVFSNEILKRHNLPDVVIDAATDHHEKLNGRGYPNQKTAKDISLLTRILTVADIISALSVERSYRSSMSHEGIIEVLVNEVNIGDIDKTIAEKAIQLMNRGELDFDAVHRHEIPYKFDPQNKIEEFKSPEFVVD